MTPSCATPLAGGSTPVTTVLPLICSGVIVVATPIRDRLAHRLPPDKDNAYVSIVASPIRARQVHHLPPGQDIALDDVIHALVVGHEPVIADSHGVVSDLRPSDPTTVLLMPDRMAASSDRIDASSNANTDGSPLVLDFGITTRASRFCGKSLSVTKGQLDQDAVT